MTNEEWVKSIGEYFNNREPQSLVAIVLPRESRTQTIDEVLKPLFDLHVLPEYKDLDYHGEITIFFSPRKVVVGVTKYKINAEFLNSTKLEYYLL